MSSGAFATVEYSMGFFRAVPRGSLAGCDLLNAVLGPSEFELLMTPVWVL